MMLIVCIIDIQCLCSLQYYNYVCGNVLFCFFFFKQKTAYEMRISDWSSDVCSSDLEKRPLDEQIAAIQARYNVYIAPLKNKQPGSVSKAVAALGALLTVWLNKLEAEKQEREQAAREAHEKAQQEAIEARRAAIGTGDLNAIDAADDLLGAAGEAGQAPKARAEGEKGP